MTGNAFEKFLEGRRGDLRRIAGRTRGEVSADELMSEAWLIALEIGNRRGWAFDFSDEDDQDTLLAWMHNRFVKYADKAIRNAIRLDRGWDSDDGEQPGIALAKLLTAPLDTDPQVRQQALDERDELMGIARRSYSEAVAYLLLLIRVDWHLDDLAELLAIGQDALKRRLRAAGLRARSQSTLFDGIDQIDPDFEPRRRIRWTRRKPSQEREFATQSALWT